MNKYVLYLLCAFLLFSCTKKTYHIEYDLNISIFDISSGKTPHDDSLYLSGDKVRIKSPVGIDSNKYTFEKWNSTSDGSGKSYYPGDNLEIFKNDITVYGIWKPKSYTLSFSGNGNTHGTLPNPIILKVDETFPIRELYGIRKVELGLDQKLKGWAKEDGGIGYYTSTDIYKMPPENVTLCALWSGFIGAKGPAGGTIFFDKGDNSHGWRFLESSSKSFRISDHNTSNIKRAINTCTNYEQNSFSNWFLPSIDQLKDLKKEGLLIKSDYYYSSDKKKYKKGLVSRMFYAYNGDIIDVANDETGVIIPIRKF